MDGKCIGLPPWDQLPAELSYWLARRGGSRLLVELYRTDSVAVGEPPAPAEGQWLIVSGGGSFDGEPPGRLGTFRWTGQAWEGVPANPRWDWSEITLISVDDRVRDLDGR